jgi:putative transposase
MSSAPLTTFSAGLSTGLTTGSRFRAYPTRAQTQTLARWIGCQTVIYSAKAAENRYYRKFKRRFPEHCGCDVPLDQEYARCIDPELTPWLREVPSQILRSGAHRSRAVYQRFCKGLSGCPVPKKKSGRRSALITCELFTFVPLASSSVTPGTGTMLAYKLLLGTAKFPVGEPKLVAHRTFTPPKSLLITIEAGKWFVTFSNETEIPLPSKAETAEWLAQLGEAELLERPPGADRGVVIPFATSSAGDFDFSAVQKKRLSGRERHARLWQKRAARRQKGSKIRKQAYARAARYKAYGRNLRHDFAHQASHRLAADGRFLLYVLEDLKTKNMTASARGTREALDKNVVQKQGLNRGILGSAWGKTALFLDYKTQRRGKLLIKVPAHPSSQECSLCGHTHPHPENRASQARFVCTPWGHTANADTNAARVLAQRGAWLLLAGGVVVEKAKKRCAIRKVGDGGKGEGKDVGPGWSERLRERVLEATPVEIQLSRTRLKAGVHGWRKQETPVTAPQSA